MEGENSFGQWLKHRRHQLDLTQQQLADCAGCSAVTIRKFEIDERRPSRELAELLTDCLSILPEERELFMALARGVTPATGSMVHPQKGGIGQPSALPQPATPFVGRTEEIAQIAWLLADPACRLLTLVGPGGMGKTRLALAAAQAQVENFADGVVFVPLSAVTQPAQLPQAIAHSLSLSLSGASEPGVQLGRYLQNKELLLALDNFEQLLEGTDRLADWLQQAPRTKWLITSRERLNLVEEWLLPVQGFSQAAPGVALFEQIARRVQPNFVWAGQETAVAHICQLVGGMPLAIELAAGWTAVMSCEQIVAHIQQSFDFLSTNLRNVPQRHRSLRHLFDYSWQLLPPLEQTVLMKLSVFRGGFALEEAMAVAGADLPILLTLANKSFTSANGGRYELHELTRQYAAEKLSQSGQATAVYQQHEQTFLTMAETAEPHLYGPQAIAWFQRLEDEQDNFRAALAWALANGAVTSVMRLVNSLWWFWFRRGYWHEAENWLSTTLEQPSVEDSPARCHVLLQLSTILALQGRYGEAVPHLLEALAMARRLEDAESLIAALLVLGQAMRDKDQAFAAFSEAEITWKAVGNAKKPWVLAHLYHLVGERWRENGRYEEAVTYYQQSLSLYRAIGNVDHIAYPLGNLGRFALRHGRLAEAHRLITESVALSKAIGNRQGVADWLLPLALVTLYQGNIALAETYLQETRILHREMGNWRGQPEVLVYLGLVSLLQGDTNKAEQHVQQSLEIYQAGLSQIKESSTALLSSTQVVPPEFVDMLHVAGLVAAAQIQDEKAVTLFAIAIRLKQQNRHELDLPLQQRVDEAVTAVRVRLAAALYQSALEKGHDGSLDEAIRFALGGEGE